MKGFWQRTMAQWAAALLLCAFVLQPASLWAASSAPESASSSETEGDSSAASDVSDASDASGAEEPEEEESILAPPGEGLYRPSYTVAAEAFCLVNEETGLIVAEKNGEVSLTAASLVKMMTCILVAEHMRNFAKDYKTTMVDSTGKSWVYDHVYGMNASTADIRLGETLSMEELLHAALLPSGNEAALLMADYVCGGYVRNFMYQMNTRAKALGCTGTYFDDACGLSEYNVTTARDMTLITREFMKYPELVEAAASPTYEIQAHEQHNNPYTVHNTNRLLVDTSPYYQNYASAASAVVAGKTGSLGDWQNFASMATKDGQSYICVILISPNVSDPIAPTLDPPGKGRPALVETAELYQWAFSNLTVQPTLDVTKPVTELRVLHSTQQDTVKLMPSDDVKAVLPVGEGESFLKRKYDLPESVAAPVEEGAVLGNVTLSIGGQNIGSVQLMAQSGVERNETLMVIDKTGEFFTSTFMKVFVVLLLAAAAIYGGLLWLANNSRARKNKARQQVVSQAKPPGRPQGQAVRTGPVRKAGSGMSTPAQRAQAKRKPPQGGENGKGGRG